MKKSLLLIFGIFFIFSLVACSEDANSSEGDGGSEGSDSEETYSMKIGHVNPPGEPTYEIFEKFVKPELEDRSDGRISVDVYPQSQLGSENELMEQTKIGSVQVAAASAPSNHSKKLNMFYLPYLFPKQQQLWDVLDGELGEEINQDLEKNAGIKVMGWWSVGMRHMFTKEGKEIHSIDDVQGLKVRVMEKPVLMDIFDGMGMLPTPLPYGEVYGSMATNVVDAAENDPSGYRNMKFYEVGPNYSLTSHLGYPKVIVINPDFYNGLPDDLKTIVDEVFAEAEQKQRQMFLDVMDRDIKWLKENGVNVIEDVDIKSFQDAAQPLWKEVDGIDQDLLNRVLEARE